MLTCWVITRPAGAEAPIAAWQGGVLGHIDDRGAFHADPLQRPGWVKPPPRAADRDNVHWLRGEVTR